MREAIEIEDQQNTRGRAPLRGHVLFFFVWFAPWFFGGALRLNYSEDGQLLKAKQSHVFAIAGFISLIVDSIVTVYFNLGPMVSMVVLAFLFAVCCVGERKVTYEVKL